MKELLEIFKFAGSFGPSWLLLFVVVFAMWKSGALVAIFSHQDDYVRRDQCHSHIDGLKNEIAESRTDLKDHIEQVDKKVNMLLERALK
jgi:hypothetical protein